MEWDIGQGNHPLRKRPIGSLCRGGPEKRATLSCCNRAAERTAVWQGDRCGLAHSEVSGTLGQTVRRRGRWLKSIREAALSHVTNDQSDHSMDDMLPVVYEQLRQLAAFLMQRERSNHTLPPTAIVHEAYLRIANQHSEMSNREHFMAVASEMIRRILVDHARGRLALKRGGNLTREQIDVQELPFECTDEGIVELDEALDQLQSLHGRQARVVELRFFGGLSVVETARLLDVSPQTISADWMVAKAWLQERLKR